MNHQNEHVMKIMRNTHELYMAFAVRVMFACPTTYNCVYYRILCLLHMARYVKSSYEIILEMAFTKTRKNMNN